MVSSQMNKDTKEIAPESYRGEILESLQTTKMYPGQLKVGFFINEDCLGHLCKVSSDFVRICKLSKIQAEKRKW